MSIPQYKELVLYRLQEMIREQTAYLVEQEPATTPRLPGTHPRYQVGD